MPTPRAPMRILLVTARYVPEIGGTELHTKALAEHLVARGHQVTVLTTDRYGDLSPDEWLAGVHVHRVRAWPANRDYYVAPGIWSIIRQGSWDLVHCQGYHTAVAPLAMLAAWRARLPFIVAFHSGGHSSRIRRLLRRPQHWVLRPLLARAASLVAGSAFEAAYFGKRLHLPADRFVVVPVLPTLPVMPLAAPAADTPLIMSVGRLERYKGHHQLIATLPALRTELPGVRVRIVGEGPYEAELRRLAVELNVADIVEIAPVPATARVEMVRLLRQAALVVSFSEYESAGLAIREALALRRPVLVREGTARSALDGMAHVATVSAGATRTEIAAAIVDLIRNPTSVERSAVDVADDWVAAYELIYQGALDRLGRFVTVAAVAVQAEGEAERSGNACHSGPSASASAQPAE